MDLTGHYLNSILTRYADDFGSIVSVDTTKSASVRATAYAAVKEMLNFVLNNQTRFLNSERDS